MYDILQTCGTHPSADEIYALVRERIPHISLATVYKALDSLVNAGLAAQIPGLDGPTRFDRSPLPHIHVRSLSDGKVYDVPREIEEEAMADLALDLAARLQEEVGFRMARISLEILGEFAPDRQPDADTRKGKRDV